MAKDVIVNLKINGVNQAITNFDQLETSIKDLETQLKQATYGSAQFEELSKNLKKARDQAEEFQVQTKGLNVQDKMAEVAKAGAAIAGAFNLAQQAATAFGSDSKQAAEIAAAATQGLVVVQSIQAISESKLIMSIIRKTGAFIADTAALVVNRIANIGNTTAIVAETVATEGATIATKGFTAALKANPVGAIITIILTAVAALAAFTDAFKSNTKEIDLNAEAIKRLNADIAFQNKESERRVAYMEASGGLEAEIHKEKIRNFEAESKKLKEKNDIYKKQQQEDAKSNAESLNLINNVADTKERAAEKEGMLVYKYIKLMTGKNITTKKLTEEQLKEIEENNKRIYELETLKNVEVIRLFHLENDEKKKVETGAANDYLKRLRDLHQEIHLLQTEDLDQRGKIDLEHQRQNALDEIAQLKIYAYQKAHLIADLNLKFDLLEAKRAEDQRIKERDLIEKYQAEILAIEQENRILSLKDGEFMLASELATFQKLDDARQKDLLEIKHNVRDKILNVEQGEWKTSLIEENYRLKREEAIKAQRTAQLARAITAEQDETNAVVQEITNRGDKTLGTMQNTKALVLQEQLDSLLQQKAMTEQIGKETVKIEEAIAQKRHEIQKNSSDNLLAQINGSLQALQAASQSALAIIASQQEIGMNQIAAEYSTKQDQLDAEFGKANTHATELEKTNRDIREANAYLGDKKVKELLDQNAEIYAKREYKRKVAQSQQDRKRAEEEDKLREKQFGIQKAASIAAATISVIQGAINAYTSLSVIPVVGVGLGIAAAAAAVAAGAFQIAAIESTTFQKANLPDIYTDPSGLNGGSGDAGGSGGTKISGGRNYFPVRNGAAGGILVGPSHAEGGIMSPFGELEGGEAVINKISTQRFGSILSSINQAGGGSPIPSTGREDAAPIFKTYVVASDVSSQQEADFKIRQIAKL